ncbi:helix-turn-helix domain-containing protein [Gilliamella apicola]
MPFTFIIENFLLFCCTILGESYTQLLNRHPSTISREIKRNSKPWYVHTF